jgi:hypothetical protein
MREDLPVPLGVEREAPHGQAAVLSGLDQVADRFNLAVGTGHLRMSP